MVKKSFYCWPREQGPVTAQSRSNCTAGCFCLVKARKVVNVDNTNMYSSLHMCVCVYIIYIQCPP